jgi:predicted DNA-binding protein
MLGIRLSVDDEEQLARHAKAVGRGKSVVAREWILERLERESVDQQMRRAARLIADATTREELDRHDADTREWLRALDDEDGGYDWAPEGPPA